jgi:thiol-disulfide isomerase/thioredoxin
MTLKNKLFVLIPLAAVALAAGIWLAQARYAPRLAEAPVLAALWQLEFPDPQGKSQALSQWRGQVLVLNFWASWCAPCREEIPDFVALREQHHQKGVEFVGIAVDNAANVAQFLQTQAISYPILVGEGAAHSLSRELGNPSGALPFTIVLDRNGNVVFTHLGRVPRALLDTTLVKVGA